MPRLFLLLVVTLIAPPGFGARGQADTDEASYTVSYVEVMASGESRAAALAAFREYEAARNEEPGYVRFEIFEESDAPGHFAVIETWRDVNAYQARGAVVQEQLLAALGPIRISDYDQRPYKTLTVGSSTGFQDRQAVHVISHVDVSPNSAVPPEGPVAASGRGGPSGRREWPVRRSAACDARESFHGHRVLGEPGGARGPRGGGSHAAISRRVGADYRQPDRSTHIRSRPVAVQTSRPPSSRRHLTL